MSGDSNSDRDPVADYAARRGLYVTLAQEVQFLLEKYISEAKIRGVSIHNRAKTAESFAAKINRKNYQRPLTDVTDLAGVRVVCNYDSEVHEISKIIDGRFDVQERIARTDGLSVDNKGYRGLHLVVTLGDRYAGGRYDGITSLKCEIQLRTVLQDAWAIISHQLVYKNEEAVPIPLRRDLHNVASLLEIAQGIFDSVKTKRESYQLELESKQSKRDPTEFLSQPLDLDTLIAFTRWKFPDLDVSEALSISLLKDIDADAYPTLRELNIAIDMAHAAVEAYRAENPDFFSSGTDFITKSLGFVDTTFRARHLFSPITLEAFTKFKDLVVGSPNAPRLKSAKKKKRP